MVSKIILPKNILDEIKIDGINTLEESKIDISKVDYENREASGVLSGIYNYENDSITISEINKLPTKIGDDTIKANLYNGLTLLFSIPRFVYVALKLASYRQRLKKRGKAIGVVDYHTHPFYSSWSDSDLSHPFALPDDISTAGLLYIVSKDEFKAIDKKRKSVEIEII